MKRHIPFQPYLIWSAILLGLFGGFGLGAHLVYSLAFASTPSNAFAGLIQVHGHLQLLGWTGFFIIGVSLFKLPRLTSSTPLEPYVTYLIYGTLIVGLVLKSAAQVLIFYSAHQSNLRTVACIGSLLESTGILLYFFALFKNTLSFSSQSGAYAAKSIKPFLLVSFVGWFAYALINAALGVAFLSEAALILPQQWNNLAIETYIHLVLLPTCFAFSISTFPIFLRLRAPTWPVARVAILYALGVCIYLLSLAAHNLSLTTIAYPLKLVGVCLRVMSVLWLIAELDLIRVRRPWFRKFRENQDRENRPPRRYAGDYGQFGNFEWLIYAAYSWLLAAAVSEFAALWFSSAPSATIIRHFYLLGFVTHLILGMGVRIIPGFLGKNRIAYPFLVRLSLLLILLATTGRTLPVAFSALNNEFFRLTYGLSGVVAMLAIACLGVNLLGTVRQSKRPNGKESV